MSGPLFFRTVPNRGEQEPGAMGIDELARRLGVSSLNTVPGITGDGVADDTEGMLRAAAYLNQAPFRTLLSVGQSIRMSVPFPALLQSDIGFHSLGSRITQTGSNGNIFTVGSATQAANRVKMSGWQFNWTGTPSPDDMLMDWYNTADSGLTDFQLFNCPSIARFGSATTKAIGCTLSDFKGNCNKGGIAQNNVLIQNASSFRVQNYKLNGPGMGTPQAGLYTTLAQIAAAPAVIRIKPVSGAFCDTGWIETGTFQLFTTSTPPNLADGKPLGVILDRTLGDIQNVTIDNNASAMDHTTCWAVALIDVNGTQIVSPTDRDINILNSRMAVDAGGGILVDLSAPTSGLVARGVKIDGNFIFLSDDTGQGCTIRGLTALDAWSLTRNNVNDDHPSVAKTVAFVIGSSGGTIMGNQVGSSSATACNIATAFRFENPDMDDLWFSANRGKACPTFLSEPNYTVASGARHVEHDRPYTVATVAAKASPKNIGSKCILTDGAGNKKECIADGNIFRYHDGTAV